MGACGVMFHVDEWRSLLEGILHLCDISTECTVQDGALAAGWECVYISLCCGTCISTKSYISEKQGGRKKKRKTVWQCEMTQDLMYSVLYVPEEL